jgi:enoyl-CoA hydratase/carnithine racemase
MELESQVFGEQLKGQDAKEGIRAFTEKEKPSFKGE